MKTYAKPMFIFVFLLLVPFAFAGTESCYIRLSMNETKFATGIQFRLISIENLYGNYGSFVNPYNTGSSSDYIVNVYTDSVEKYSLNSGRFTFYDNFDATGTEAPGGVIESDSAVIDSFIPYSTNISNITVTYNGTETNLQANTSLFKCARTCKFENEPVNFDNNESCCSEFSPAQQDDGTYVCTDCGDGICSTYENEYSCYSDCRTDLSTNGEPCINDHDCEFNRCIDGHCIDSTIWQRFVFWLKGFT